MISNEPIRVLEVFGRMNRGGAEAMIMNLYRKMDRKKVQLDFMVHTDEHCQYDDEIRELGGCIYRVPRFRIYNYFSYRRAWRKFFMEHEEHRIVHGHMGSTAAIYLHEANKSGRFTIAHSHSADNGYRTFADILYKMFSFPTRFVAKQLYGCSTEAGVSRYGQRAVKSEHYRNFPNAICLEDFIYNIDARESKRKELGIAPDQQLIIHVGRVSPPKNPPMLFDIFKAIVSQDNKSICLWVGTGEQEFVYREKIMEAGLQNRIRMTGVRRDVNQLLQASDVFLFPSLWEGLPVSVIEAQAAGLPCVIADTISKEVAVSSLVEFHSLKEAPYMWAERCLSLAIQNRQKRYSPLSELESAGYDINASVLELTDFYMQKSNL